MGKFIKVFFVFRTKIFFSYTKFKIKATCRGATVAVKIPKKTLKQEQIKAFKHEVEVMSKINRYTFSLLFLKNYNNFLFLDPFIALFMGAHISTNSVKIGKKKTLSISNQF